MNSEAAVTLSRDEIVAALSRLAAPHLASPRSDPARPDPAQADPARPDPARPDPAQPDPGRTLDLDQRLIEDLGLDSISLLALVVEVENHFRVVLEPEDEAGIERVGDLVDAIASRLS